MESANVRDKLLNLIAIQPISIGWHIIFACRDYLRQCRRCFVLDFLAAQVWSVKTSPKGSSSTVRTMACRAFGFECACRRISAGCGLRMDNRTHCQQHENRYRYAPEIAKHFEPPQTIDHSFSFLLKI
jgi:hypothetical protein